MSVLEYVCIFIDHLAEHRTILDMMICGATFFVRDGHTVWLAATGDWKGCWLQCRAQSAACRRCGTNQTVSPFILMEGAVDYESA